MFGQEGIEEAELLGEEDGHAGLFLRRHLIYQAERSLVVLAVALCVLTLKGAGHPGRWVVARLIAATRIDTAVPLARAFDSSRLHGLSTTIRTWLTREWRVTGSNLRKEGAAPPVIIWPVTGGRLIAAENTQAGPEPGLDIQVAAGTAVQAAAAGEVFAAEREKYGGLYLVLVHAGGWRTVYGHCQALLVDGGERVAIGQTVALVGSARPPAPAHLHFELWGPQGQVDPRPFLTPAKTGDGPV